MPEYPAMVLMNHTGLKGIQLGSVLGLVASPIYGAWKKKPFLESWRLVMPSAVTFSVLSAFGFLYAKKIQGELDIPGVDDRAYRISRNAGQNEVDALSGVGFVIGTITAAVATQKAANILPGALTGVAGSIVYHVLKPHIMNAINSASPDSK